MRIKNLKITYLLIFIFTFILVGCSKVDLLKKTEKYYNSQNTKSSEILRLTSTDKKLSNERLFIQDLNVEDSISSKEINTSTQEMNKFNESKNLKAKSPEDKIKEENSQKKVPSSTNSKSSQTILTKQVEGNKELSDKEVIGVINEAYVTSVNLLHKNIDGYDSIGDGIFCRPKDKNLTYDRIISTLRNHFSMSFLNKSILEKECIKVVDGKVYVLALQGAYNAKREFIILDRKDKDNYISVKVLVKSKDGNVTSDIVLVKELGKWKVNSGSIFPQR